MQRATQTIRRHIVTGSAVFCGCLDSSVDRPIEPCFDRNGERRSAETLVVSCIDPLARRLARAYADATSSAPPSQVAIPGAAVGAVAPSFEDWRRAFWDHLDRSIERRRIRRLLVVDHRECGALTQAYGWFEPGSDEECDLHRLVLGALRRAVARRHPRLEVATVLVDRDGRIERVGRPLERCA